MAERMPPNDVKIEMAVLGSILRENSQLIAVADVLRPESFYKHSHQLLFGLMLELHQQSKPIDLVILADILKTRGLVEDVGGYGALGELWDAAPTAANCEHYANLVRQYADARRLIHVCTEALREAYAGAPADDLVASTQKEINAIGLDAKGSQNYDIVTVLHEVQAELDRRCKAGSAIVGVPSGLLDLDKLVSGFQPGELVILAARTSVGKTSFALTIMRNAAKFGKTSLIFSLEMDRRELVAKMWAGEAEVNSWSMRQGRLKSDEIARLVLASGSLAPLPIWINDTSAQRVRNVAAATRQLKQKTSVDLVIVDYLQLMGVDDRRLPRHEQVADITRNLKLFAREFRVPVLCLAQLNRQADMGERPKLSHLRECVVGSTKLIDADTGLQVQIKDVVSGRRVFGMSSDQKIVAGTVSDAWKTKTDKVYRLTTCAGRQIEATATHPIMTQRGFVELLQLNIASDSIATVLRMPNPSNCKDDKLDLCRFLGYMIGNGTYIRHKQVGLCIPDNDAFADAVGIAKQYWPDINLRFTSRREYNDVAFSRSVQLGRANPIRRWLAEIGADNKYSYQKNVPPFVWERGQSGAVQFLAGYMATDGCVAKMQTGRWSVRFDTTSHELAQDVLLLLSRIGVAAKISKPYRNRLSKHDLYRIALVEVGSNLVRFAKMVPVSGYRGDRLADMVAEISKHPKRSHKSLMSLPRSVSELASQNTDWRHQGKTISRTRCMQIAEKFGRDDLRMWCESDVLWEPIRSIEYIGEQEVYDITIPGIHCFAGNGIIASNSGAIEQDADSVLFLHRPEARDDTAPTELIDLIVAKQRNGPTGMATLLFRKSNQRFENFDPGVPVK